MSSILVIPDIQAKPGQRLKHLEWLAKYIKAKRPDCIVMLGDLWDMPSLSSYDKGKKAAEGRRVHLDWEVGCRAAHIITPNIKGYKPKLIFTEGNHEERIKRHENEHPELEGSLPSPVDYMESLGWDAYPFLEVAKWKGVSFCHFFPRTSKGTVTAGSSRSGASSALAMLRANMTSCVAGHKQGLDIATYNPSTDRRLRGIIAGSYYLHDEGYMGPQGNSYWRGVLMLNNVRKGNFDITEVSLDYLRRKYK